MVILRVRWRQACVESIWKLLCGYQTDPSFGGGRNVLVNNMAANQKVHNIRIIRMGKIPYNLFTSKMSLMAIERQERRKCLLDVAGPEIYTYKNSSRR